MIYWVLSKYLQWLYWRNICTFENTYTKKVFAPFSSAVLREYFHHLYLKDFSCGAPNICTIYTLNVFFSALPRKYLHQLYLDFIFIGCTLKIPAPKSILISKSRSYQFPSSSPPPPPPPHLSKPRLKSTSLQNPHEAMSLRVVVNLVKIIRGLSLCVFVRFNVWFSVCLCANCKNLNK